MPSEQLSSGSLFCIFSGKSLQKWLVVKNIMQVNFWSGWIKYVEWWIIDQPGALCSPSLTPDSAPKNWEAIIWKIYERLDNWDNSKNTLINISWLLLKSNILDIRLLLSNWSSGTCWYQGVFLALAFCSLQPWTGLQKTFSLHLLGR